MFVAFAIHHVKPEAEDALLESMSRFGPAQIKHPGLQQVFALRSRPTGNMFGLSIWDSRESFSAAWPTARQVIQDDPFDEWHTAPTDFLRLDVIAAYGRESTGDALDRPLEQVGHINIAIHHYKEDAETLVLDSMKRFGQAAASQPGLLHVFTLQHAESKRALGLALWESPDARKAATPAMVEAIKDDRFDEWETAPIQVFEIEILWSGGRDYA